MGIQPNYSENRIQPITISEIFARPSAYMKQSKFYKPIGSNKNYHQTPILWEPKKDTFQSVTDIILNLAHLQDIIR